MGRKILYGILGEVGGFIVGAIILSVVYSPSSTATGPDYRYILCMLLFNLCGMLAGVKFGGFLNTRYGDKPLRDDSNAPKIEAFYFILFGFWPALLGSLAIIVLCLAGASIPALAVLLYPTATVAFLLHYKHYETSATEFSPTWWLKRSQYISAVKLMFYIMPASSALALIFYFVQMFRG